MKATSITLGKNVTSIAGNTFWYNTSLQNIEIDASNPSYLAENGAVYTKDKKTLIAFVNNAATSFTIPNGVEEIGSNAIFQRTKLKEIIIPASVITIKEQAFKGCTGLTKITIPNSVKSIGSLAFTECSNLRTITIDNSNGSIAGSPWGCIYGARAIKWLK